VNTEAKSPVGNPNLHPFGYKRCDTKDCQRKALRQGLCRKHFLASRPTEWETFSDDQLYETITARFNAELEELVDAAYRAYYGLPMLHYTRYLESIYNLIQFVPDSPHIDKDDLRQHLRLQWFIYSKRYRDNKLSTVDLKYYLMRISTFALRDMLCQQQRIPTQSFEYQFSLSPDETLAKPPKITLAFVVYGSTLSPFSCLSSYERYLLYLHYAMDKSTNEIAQMMGHYKSTISNSLEEIKLKLRQELMD
jgi:DNA-directed RNA polymerase specialized sigma24 family protein